MSNFKQITVSADKWSEYLRKKAQANALKREIESLESEFNLPEPAALAAEYGAQTGDKLMLEIINGNGQAIGKLSVFWFPGSETPPSWRKRIS